MHEPRRLTASVPVAVQRLRERRRGPLFWLGVTRLPSRSSDAPAASAEPVPVVRTHTQPPSESHPFAMGFVTSAQSVQAMVQQ